MVHFLMDKKLDCILTWNFKCSLMFSLLPSTRSLNSATFILSPSCRYKELLQWAGAALTAQGLDEQAVNQTLVDLQQPVEMEEVKREMGDRARPGEEPGSMEALEEEEEEEDLPAKKRFWYSEGSDVSLLPQSALCDLRLSQDCDPYWDQDSDQDTELGREPSVPGPGFVLVAFQVEGCVAEVRRTPLAITEYLQLSLEEVCKLGAEGLACSPLTYLLVCLSAGFLPGLQSGLSVHLPAPGNIHFQLRTDPQSNCPLSV